jgi:hypothetical protein
MKRADEEDGEIRLTGCPHRPKYKIERRFYYREVYLTDKQAVNVFGVVLMRLRFLEQMNDISSLFCGYVLDKQAYKAPGWFIMSFNFYI